VLAAAVGIGLRSVHVADVIATRPAVAWLEVHAENYMASGGPTLAALERIRERTRSRSTPSACRSEAPIRSTPGISAACALWSNASSPRWSPIISPGAASADAT